MFDLVPFTTDTKFRSPRISVALSIRGSQSMFYELFFFLLFPFDSGKKSEMALKASRTFSGVKEGEAF